MTNFKCFLFFLFILSSISFTTYVEVSTQTEYQLQGTIVGYTAAQTTNNVLCYIAVKTDNPYYSGYYHASYRKDIWMLPEPLFTLNRMLCYGLLRIQGQILRKC
ncbi:MAG: hypothetical protein ACL7AX_13160 [Candidatus Arsenophonus phytopathogenicus]